MGALFLEFGLQRLEFGARVDDMVLELAINGRADAIVTNNLRHLREPGFVLMKQPDGTAPSSAEHG